ncbi:hypothetical protein ACLKA6_012722 [Drosophila palustris]
MRAVNEKGIDIDDIASTSGATQGGMHGSCAPMGGTQGFGAASVHAERAALKMNTGPVLANGAPGHGGTDVPLTEMKTTDAGRGVNTVQVQTISGIYDTAFLMSAFLGGRDRLMINVFFTVTIFFNHF